VVALLAAFKCTFLFCLFQIPEERLHAAQNDQDWGYQVLVRSVSKCRHHFDVIRAALGGNHSTGGGLVMVWINGDTLFCSSVFGVACLGTVSDATFLRFAPVACI
jgi:hypothetical protein